MKIKNFKLKINQNRSGQVMILTVLALGSTLLGATTIAGLLMVYQIRQATDFANSGKAIFAADSGVEWSLYNFSCSLPGATQSPCPVALPVLTNGARVEVNCLDATGIAVACTDPNLAEVKSLGSSGSASRAFKVNF